MIDHRFLLPASTFSARYCLHPRNPEPKAAISAGYDTHDPDAYCPSMSDSHLLPPNRQLDCVASCGLPCNNLQKRFKHHIIDYPCWVALSALSDSLNASHESPPSRLAITPHSVLRTSAPSSFRLPTPNFRLQASGFRLKNPC